MTMDGTPTTLSDWEAYVKALAGEALRSKGINANTQPFVDILRQEGYTMLEIKEIITYFVRQFVATDQKMPEGGAFDMLEIARKDPIAKAKLILDDEQVEAMTARPSDTGPDDLDDDLELLAAD